MSNRISKEIRLKARPEGMPKASDFELAEREVPELRDGQVLVRNIWMTVDPYMRGRMIDRESYVPPFQIGEPLDGGSVGQVVESKNPKFKTGDYVVGGAGGWREFHWSDGSLLMKIDETVAPIQAYLGTVGMPGLTAYVGLLKLGEPKEGETVFVSAASGAVGAVVCQIAKIKGCRVVGTAGSDEKVAWLKDEVGVDVALNYKTCGDLTEALAKACPNGIDVYFENVGGEHLVAALNLMNVHGRIVLCGMIEQYNVTEPPAGPSNLIMAIPKRLRIEGFVVSDHFDQMPQFLSDMAGWIKDGRMKWKETVVDGLENAPDAFLGLFKGANFGKMLVKVGPDPAV